MRKVTLKPSLLVAFRVARVGGVMYGKADVVHDGDGIHDVTTWKVTKDIPNLPELKEADAVAAACRRLIAQHCVLMPFGLVAAKENEIKLTAAWTEVQTKIDTANATLKGCKLQATCVKGEIVTDDQAAADGMLQYIGGLFTELKAAITVCDAKKIRETVTAMRSVDTLLDEVHSDQLKKAMDAAKKVASKVVVEVDKKHKEIATVVQQLDLSPIDAAAVYFLETDDAPAVGDAHEADSAVRAAELPDDGKLPVVVDDDVVVTA